MAMKSLTGVIYVNTREIQAVPLVDTKVSTMFKNTVFSVRGLRSDISSEHRCTVPNIYGDEEEIRV